jgi:type IV secretory pathway TrbF-like protein
MATALNSSVFEDELIRKHDKRLLIILIAIFLALAISGTANVIYALRPHTLPYVLVLNKSGEIVTAAHPVQSTASLNEAIIRFAIMQFIRDAKSLNDNLDEDKFRLNTAFAFAREQAAQALLAYYHDGKHYPWDNYQKIWTEVTITRLPFRQPAADTYRIDWTETTHEYGSPFIQTTNWTATIKVQVTTPSDIDPLNPLGLYITSLDWSSEVVQ